MLSRNKRIIITILFIICISLLNAKTSAIWVTPWDLNTEQKVLKVINDALDWDVTDLLVEVRYRADTFYVPNRRYSDFPNTEPVSYLLRENPDFDVLQCFIDNTRNRGINIHAWVTVNVITAGSTNNLPNNHLYFTNPEWLTITASGQTIRPNQFEGAYLDPGVEAVQTYLVNVFSDLVQNYDIYGLHLDYIRYPSADFGYHPVSMERYEYYKNELKINNFEEWKELQINELARKIGQSIKQIKPQINYSAAVVPDINIATSRYSQNWYHWLDNNIIDNVYLMAYQSNNSDFHRVISGIPYEYRKNIIVGLRAWTDNGNYTIRALRDKIALTPDHFVGLSFFSYGGITSRNYQNAISEYNPRRIEGFVYSLENSPLPGAKISHIHDPNLYTYSDNYGYFYLSINNIQNNEFTCSYMNFSQTKAATLGTPLIFNLPVFTAESFKFSGIDTDKGFFLWWDKAASTLYRKVLPSDDDYILLGEFDNSVNFYYDMNLEQSPVYEYKLLHENNLQSYVYKTYPNTTIYLLRVEAIYDSQKISLKIINNTESSIDWNLADMQSNTLANGKINGINEIIEISDSLLKNRFLLFNYSQNEKETTILIDLLDIKEL